MYTYVFENKEYEVALNNVKAILFDVVTKEEEKLTAISEKAMNSGDANLQQSFIDLRSQQDDCLKLVLAISNQLAETLKKLDSYSRELRHIEDKNIADIIASITVSNGNVSTNANVNTNTNLNDYGSNNNGTNMIYNTQIQMANEAPQVQQVSVANNVPQGSYENTNGGYVASNPELQFATESATMNSSNNTVAGEIVEEVMPYDDGISTVVEEVVDYVQEVQTNQPTGASEIIEEVMPYDDGISTVVEEVVDYVQEVQGNNQTNEGEVVEEVMPYDDGISTVVAEGEAAPENGGEVVEEVMPYDDGISTVVAEGEATSENGTGEVVEEVMPYDDGISTVVAEGEATPENGTGEANLEDGNAAELGSGSDKADDNTEEAKSTVKLVIPGASTTTTNDENKVNEEKKENESNNEEVSSGPLIIPTVDSSSNDVPVENTDAATSNTLVIPSVSNSTEAVADNASEEAISSSTIDPALEAALAEDNSNKGSESNVVSLTFKKRSNDLAKAILTSGKQNKNLRNSLATQEALLNSRGFFANLTTTNESTNLEQQLVDNGLLPGDVNTQIEQMMTEANALYAAGKLEEAQTMFDKISELNKQVKGSEAKAA